MAALAAANVTVTVTDLIRMNSAPGRFHNLVTIAFGNAALTYPTGGVPLPAGQGTFGLPNGALEQLFVVDQTGGGGFVWTFDAANRKLKCWVASAAGVNQPLTEATTALAPAATTLKGMAFGA